MNATDLLSKCLSLVTRPVNTKEAQKMHKTLRQSLFSAIESSMNGGSLSITVFGRSSL